MLNGKFNSLEIIRMCVRKASAEVDPNKHNQLKILLDGKIVATTTVSHGRKTLTRKTYSSIAKQLLLTTNEFDEFLSCTYSKEKYIQNLKTKSNQTF